MAIKTCAECGRDFESGKGNTKSCPECRTMYCAECGKAFAIKPSRIKAGKGKYCSSQCYSAVRSSAFEDTTCEICGMVFRASALTKRRFCSPRCANADKGNPPVELKCKRCGGSFTSTSSAVHRRTYCSNACRYSFNDVYVEGDVAHITLVDMRGEVVATTQIDAEDVQRVRSAGSHVGAFWNTHTGSYYARIQGHNGSVIHLHRLVMDAPGSSGVDHRSNDTLDNRKSNLRLATVSENAQNRRGPQKNSASGIRGVSWDSRKRKWLACVTVNYRHVLYKRFDNKEDAEQAAIEARRKHMPFSND